MRFVDAAIHHEPSTVGRQHFVVVLVIPTIRSSMIVIVHASAQPEYTPG